MKKQQRTYSREFKLEALRLCETNGTSDTQIECDLGISCSSMYSRKKGNKPFQDTVGSRRSRHAMLGPIERTGRQ